jgi:ABC-type lipoprotein export system ATPase subunit
MSEPFVISGELTSGSHRASGNFPGETTVEARQVSKVYWDGDRKLEVLKNISLTVHKGEGVAILGPSGSGKTTLLNILSGLDTATQGSVTLAGLALGRLNENERADLRNRRLGFVFQFYHLLPEFTALENVMMPLLMRGRDVSKKHAEEKAAALLQRTGLSGRAGHYPAELSGGEQQRVAIARALANDPDILFCDEPTGNLDPETGAGIAALLRDFFEKEKKTVLVVTHDAALAGMATKVWNIVKGDWEKQS